MSCLLDQPLPVTISHDSGGEVDALPQNLEDGFVHRTTRDEIYALQSHRLARAERAPRLAAQDSRATEQVFHGTDVANAYREKDEDGLAPRDPQLAPEGRLALAYVAPGAVR